MPFAAALSEHPLATQATGEVLGQILEDIGEEPDLVVLFTTGAHAGAIEDIAAAVQAVLKPGAFIGATAAAVVGGDREVEEQPAITLWAARFGRVEARHLTASSSGGSTTLLGVDAEDLAAATALILVADPVSFPVEPVLEHLRDQHPDLVVVGGLSSGAAAPGRNRLIVNGAVHAVGAAAVLLGPGQRMTAIVSQGCRPIGRPFVVTRSEGTVVHEIAGQPALARLQSQLPGPPDEHRMSPVGGGGVHLGVVVDEHKMDFARDDFLIRTIAGIDRAAEAIVVAGEGIGVGTTVQFHVRDALSADEDLRELLTGRLGAAALLFTCAGRGIRLFGEPDHDAEVLDGVVEHHAVAGMFCTGEIGPVGARNFLHTSAASVALFAEAGPQPG